MSRSLPRAALIPMLLALGACLGVPAAPAEVTAAQALDHIREAVGWSALTGRSGGWRVTGRHRSGGSEGRFERLFTPTGRVATTAQSSSSVRFDGRDVWAIDDAGVPRRLGLGSRDRVLGRMWLATGLWLLPGASAGPASSFPSLSIATDLRRSTAQRLALALWTPGERWRATVLVDRERWLPTTLLEERPSGVVVTELADWRSNAGFLLPHRVDTVGLAGVRTTFLVESVEPMPRYAVDPFAPPPRPADTAFASDVPAALEVRLSPSRHLLVRPRLDGREVGWFLLDSGAGANAVDPQVADALGWKRMSSVAVVAGGGVRRGTYRRGGSLELGPMSVAGLTWIEQDPAPLSETLGEQVAGVLGYDLFARAVVVVDWAKRSVELHDPDRWSSPGAYVPVVLDGRIPCVLGRFPRASGWFGLDTGSNDTLAFNAPTVARHGLVGDREELEPITAQTLGGPVQGLRGSIRWFEVGGSRLRDVPVTLVEAAPAAYGAASPDGYLGLGLLGSFRVVFDLPHERVAFLEP